LGWDAAEKSVIETSLYRAITIFVSHELQSPDFSTTLITAPVEMTKRRGAEYRLWTK
jgi:hypothetical protein